MAWQTIRRALWSFLLFVTLLLLAFPSALTELIITSIRIEHIKDNTPIDEYRFENAEVLGFQRAYPVDPWRSGNNVSSQSYRDWKKVVVDLPRLPLGNWNTAEIGLKPDTLLEVSNPWHPMSIEYVDFVKVRSLKNVSTVQRTRADVVQVVSHPFFETPVVMKIASFPSDLAIQAMEREIGIYQLLENTDIAPRFLGHVTEDGRVIGFLIEYIADARTAAAVWSDEFSSISSSPQETNPHVLERDFAFFEGVTVG
ncbi:Uu.00g144800.m01.CDS01 [Anthostomella pinea]|uniref:Uu.00g144800.m01.CDS01 n=1 Tax=Anthostomella pinea TaxID=933095 RepID=A0AAI8YLU3_9PEZI|nr:Uu.00g144800.m01.CDS01 [Anthostomella pinea]